MSGAIRRWGVGVAACVCLTAAAVRAQTAAPFLIRDGDRVLFVGDSITERGAYLSDLAAYFAIRWPAWRVELLDRGLFGARAVEAAAGVGTLLDAKPQLVVLFFGVNDGRYQAFRQDLLTQYLQALRSMVTRVRAAGSAVAVVTPTVIDPDVWKGTIDYNAVLDRYAQAVRDLGRELDVRVLDVHGALREAQAHAKAAIPGFTMFPENGVHPSAAGHLLIAARMLRDLGAPPLDATAVIDAASATVTTAHGCRISELAARDGALSFVRHDDRWWWPIDPDAHAILPWAPDVRTVSAVRQQVRGLPPGSYRVLLDDQKIDATFTHAQLANGVYVSLVAPAGWPARLADLRQQVVTRQRVLSLAWDPLQLQLPAGVERAAILDQVERLTARLRDELTPVRQTQPVRWLILPQRGPS